MSAPTERPALTPEQQARVNVGRQLADAHGQGREALAVYLDAREPSNPWPLAANALARTTRQLLEIIEDLTGGSGPAPRLDSELWTCRGCGGQFVGRRTADDRCRYCAGGAR
jgi:rubrerythrin